MPGLKGQRASDIAHRAFEISHKIEHRRPFVPAFGVIRRHLDDDIEVFQGGREIAELHFSDFSDAACHLGVDSFLAGSDPDAPNSALDALCFRRGPWLPEAG